MPDTTCITCGGEDFYKDAGYFFCSECHSRAPDLQEQEFEQPDPLDDSIAVSKSTRLKSSISSKTPQLDQITSWECYNYILLGLVNELIELGAHANLKPIVQTIWFQYLKKSEVIHEDKNQAPNLPAYNNKHDAKVLFGRSKKKKVYKRKRTTSCSSVGSASDAESTVSRKEQNRLKRIMAKAVYESQQTELTLQSESSLMNQSLGSLKSNTSDRQENFLTFSKSAKTELQAHMSKAHLKEHIEDVDVLLNCHSISYRTATKAYAHSAEVMSQSKLYAILYLGLLINKDDIHLGDMLRFMNEGSLSYNHYQHFFPEDVEAQATFLSVFKVNKVYKHDTYRLAAGKMADYLQLANEIPTPNMINLIRRYCHELNLPTEICDICIAFLADTQPKMKITAGLIPNYEARAMCVIVFVLKLLFGLDDVTECHLSSFATLINNKAAHQNDDGADDATEMFNFMDWLQTLLYRRDVLARHHFPTGFHEKNFSRQTYIDHINTFYHKYDIQRQEDLDYDNIERLVFNLEEYAQSGLQFAPSMTPLFDNLKTLYESGKLETCPQLDVLLRNFEPTSLEFLKVPKKYFSSETEILHRGANSNIRVVPVFHQNRLYDSHKSLVTCKLTDGAQSIPKVTVEQPDEDGFAETVMEFFDHLHADKFHNSQNSFNEFGFSAKEYTKHYRPESRYWLRLGVALARMRTDAFEQFWRDFPYHYRLVLAECAKITSQCVKDMALEFNNFDAYVCYRHLFDDNCKLKGKNNHLDNMPIRTVKLAILNW